MRTGVIQCRRLAILCLLAAFLILLWSLVMRSNNSSDVIPEESSDKDSKRLAFLPLPTARSSIKIVNTLEIYGPTESGFPCRFVRIADLTYPMCTYREEQDGPVSGVFLGGKYFEAAQVRFIMESMEKDGRLQFVDLGANIGTYTLAVAHMRRSVLAVEPNAQTSRRLATSIRLGNVTDHVTLLLNAVSNEHATLGLGTDLHNRGDTYLLKEDNCTGVQARSEHCADWHAVDTITLDDLLPLMTSDQAIIKADVQGAEMKVFHPATASKFFSRIHVPVIFMEWEFFRLQHPDAEKRKEIDDWLLDFFYRLNYTVHAENTLTRLGPDWSSWPYDVIFLKQ